MNPESLTPDPRWSSLATRYGDLLRAADEWAVPEGGPPEVKRMLIVCRHLFLHSWFVYDFLAVASAQSFIAIEAALRDVLGEKPRKGGPTMHNLVEMAVARDLIPQHRADHAATAVQLRNNLLHVDGQRVDTPAIASQVIARSHELVADLYADWPGDPTSKGE